MRVWGHTSKRVLKGMIFILNTNPISLSFWDSWSFNIMYEGNRFGTAPRTKKLELVRGKHRKQ